MKTPRTPWLHGRARVTGFCLAILLGCQVAPAEEPSDDAPLEVRAWLKTGEPKSRSTRILRHLEGLDLAAKPPLFEYGGLPGETREARGYFRAERSGNRWWLIDPHGHRFLHLAVNSVAPGDSPQNRRVCSERFGTEAQPAKERWAKDRGAEETAALQRQRGFGSGDGKEEDTWYLRAFR